MESYRVKETATRGTRFRIGHAEDRNVYIDNRRIGIILRLATDSPERDNDMTCYALKKKSL